MANATGRHTTVALAVGSRAEPALESRRLRLRSKYTVYTHNAGRSANPQKQRKTKVPQRPKANSTRRPHPGSGPPKGEAPPRVELKGCLCAPHMARKVTSDARISVLALRSSKLSQLPTVQISNISCNNRSRARHEPNSCHMSGRPSHVVVACTRTILSNSWAP